MVVVISDVLSERLTVVRGSQLSEVPVGAMRGVSEVVEKERRIDFDEPDSQKYISFPDSHLF